MKLRTETRWLVAGAWGVGLLLRLWAAHGLPRPLYGDEPWYAASAADLVGAGHSAAVDPFIRPPGTTWWIAAVFALTGAGNLGALGVANALLLSANVPLLAAIGRRAAPGRKWVPSALAWAEALDPFTLRHAGIVTSESLYLPLTLLLVYLCLRAAESASWTRVAAAGICGAALLHVRTDVTPVVFAAMAFAALIARRGGANRRTAYGRFAAAAALTAALCVPWSLHASEARAKPVFIAEQTSNPWFVERRGWWTWFSNVSMRRTQWLLTFWSGPPACAFDLLPKDAFADDVEAAQVKALLDRAHAERRLDPAIDADFRRLGEERIAREPVRFFVALPLERTARIWLDPTDSDVPPEEGSGPADLRQTVLDGWRFAWKVLFGAGFLVSLLAWRSATARGLGATLVLVRTFTLMAGFPLFGHGAKFESRNLEDVAPLTLAVLAGTRLVVRRRNGSDAAAPG